MWLVQNEQEFKELLQRYQTNPKSSVEKGEMELVEILFNHYCETGAPEAYSKVIQLLNIFLAARLPSDALASPTLLEKALANQESIEAFPLMQAISKEYLDSKKYPKYVEVRWESELDDACREEKAKLLDYLKPVLDYGVTNDYHPNETRDAFITALTGNGRLGGNSINLFPNPKLKGQPTSYDVSYRQLVEEALQKALLGNPGATQIDPEVLDEKMENFIHSAYKKRHACALRILLDDYQRGEGIMAWKTAPQIVYYPQELDKTFIFPNLTLNDILPSPQQKALLKLHFIKTEDPNSLDKKDVQLMGEILTEEVPKLKGWTVIPKSSGKDRGCVFVSPDKTKRLYAKLPPNKYLEYFCAEAISQLGIKMAESILLSDTFGNTFFVTQDLSRQYQKGAKPKSKKFAPMMEAVEARQAAYKFREEPDQTPLPQQRKEIRDFLDSTFGPEDSSDPAFAKARESFAKLLLTGVIFGLADLGLHGGNIGPYITQSGETNYTKFGVVDFAFEPQDITHDTESIEDRLANKVEKMAPIFRMMYTRLSADDFKAAAKSLAEPKAREHSREGQLLVKAPKTTVSPRVIIEETAQRVIDTLNATVKNKKILHGLIRDILKNKEMIIKNYDWAMQQLLNKPEVATQRRPSA